MTTAEPDKPVDVFATEVPPPYEALFDQQFMAIEILPRHGDPPLRVLFCGINPAPSAAVTGLFFAPPSNRFWPVLHAAGFTPRVLSAHDQTTLPSLGLAITSLVTRSTARADALTPDELRAGTTRLAQTARRVVPRWIGFLGITSFRCAFDQPRADIGPQDLRVGGAAVWVLPNPSGRNRNWPLDRLSTEYRRLADAAPTTECCDLPAGPAP